MSITVGGVVSGGIVVPDTPLPEGARVEVLVTRTRVEVPADLQAEFEDWYRASDLALERFEQMLAKEGSDAAG